jgi:hypothetical protein
MLKSSLIKLCLLAGITLVSSACRDSSAVKRLFSGNVQDQQKVRRLTPLPDRPLSEQMKQAQKRAMGTVTELRGLDFKEKVAMTQLTGWEYGTRTREMAEILGGAELRSLSKLAAAGGILPEGSDLTTLAASFAAASAGAIYSPFDKQVLLVNKFKESSLLVHEFVHALQDQHFDIVKLLSLRPYNFDQTESSFATVEGDAMSIQRRMEDKQFHRRGIDEIARAEDERLSEYRARIGHLFPPLLTETFIFRYRDGVRFVEAVRRKRGQEGVNNLFKSPPISTEQVIHPEKYFSNEQPAPVRIAEISLSERGWQLSSSTPLGEIGIRGVLMAGMPYKEAIKAAEGWNGDRAYLFDRSNTLPLFIWKTVWDRDVDAMEFFRSYSTLLRMNTESDKGLRLPELIHTTTNEDGRFSLIRLQEKSVLILRGAESDVRNAYELSL